MNCLKGLLFIMICGSSSTAFAQDNIKGKVWKIDAFSKYVSKTSPLLKDAHLNIDLAEISLDQSLIAMWPQLALTARYTRLSKTTNDSLINVRPDPNTQSLVLGVDDPEAQQLWIRLGQQNKELAEASSIVVPEDFWSFDLELKIPVSDWFMTLGPRREAARSMLRSQRARLKAQEKGLGFRAEALFFALKQKRMLVELSVSRLKDAQEKFRVASVAEKIGALKRSDLLRLKSFVHQLEAELSRAKSDEEAAREALILLTGDDDVPQRFVSPDFSQGLSKIEKNSKDIYEIALSKRAEFEALREGRDALGFQRKSIQGGKWPTFAIFGKASVANPNTRFTPLRSQFDATWEASAVLSWSPNLLFLNSSGEEKVRLEERKLDAQIEVFQDRLASQIRTELAKDKSNIDVLAAARKAVGALEEVYHLRQAEYEAGTITLSDLLGAETDLSAAKTGWINANIQAQLTRRKLSWICAFDFP